MAVTCHLMVQSIGTLVCHPRAQSPGPHPDLERRVCPLWELLPSTEPSLAPTPPQGQASSLPLSWALGSLAGPGGTGDAPGAGPLGALEPAQHLRDVCSVDSSCAPAPQPALGSLP